MPCIGGSVDASAEVVLDGKTGRIVTTDDVNAVAQALVELATDRAQAAALGEAGRDRWFEWFRYAAFRDRFLHVLGEQLAVDLSVDRDASMTG